MSANSWGPRLGCAAIVARGPDAGKICGQLPEHTNHSVWHRYQMPEEAP